MVKLSQSRSHMYTEYPDYSVTLAMTYTKCQIQVRI